MSNASVSRRSFIKSTSLLAASAAAGGLSAVSLADDKRKNITKADGLSKSVVHGNIAQSASWWCYQKYMSLDEFCEGAVKIGLKGVDLLGPKDFETVKKYGLECSMTFGPGGLNNPEQHPKFKEKMIARIDEVADAGFKNVITFSGNRGEIGDEEGLDNAVKAVKMVAGHAEKKNVIICIEYLNTKVNHPGYMFDNMKWGVELCKRVGSENMKILYDIYHAQIMEGDIIRTIRDYHQYIGHYHTGGNPGRHEIDDSQELYYPAIVKAILKTGYKGFLAHEFEPTRDPLLSLSEAVKICDV